ncbi:hypothetical protein COBT_002108 [Conglomerata obtusa]
MNKLEKLIYLLTQIKDKILILREKKIVLDELNFKLKALITSFKTGTEKNTKQKSKIDMPCADEKDASEKTPISQNLNYTAAETSIATLKDTNFFNLSFEKSIKIENKPTIETVLDGLDRKSYNAAFINNSKKILNVIALYKEASLDIIIKNSKVSKYRCIEIVNELLKSEIGILGRTNCNGIKYYIKI